MLNKKFTSSLTAIAIMLATLVALPSSTAFAADEVGAGVGGGSVNEGIELDFRGEAVDQELPGTANSDANDEAAGFSYWFGRAMSIILIVATLLVLINLFLGAFKWISSGGDSGKVADAQKQITNSIIGLIVLAAVVAIFQLLTDFLGLDFITFTRSNT